MENIRFIGWKRVTKVGIFQYSNGNTVFIFYLFEMKSKFTKVYISVVKNTTTTYNNMYYYIKIKRFRVFFSNIFH